MSMFGGSKSTTDGKGSYGAVPDEKKSGGPFGGFDLGQVTNILSGMQKANEASDGMNNAMNFTRDKINAIVEYAEEGDWSWKILGMFGGLAMMFFGGMSVLGDFLFFNYFGAVIDIYVFFFGLLAVILEYKDSLLPQKYIETLKVEAKFIYKPYGRAVLYIFFGVLLLSQSKITFQAVGLYQCLVGGLVIYYAGKAQESLDTFKNMKLSFGQLKKAYDKADKNHDGLTPRELAQMVSGFKGVTMSENEVYSAIALLDKDNSGKVSYEEFKEWYNQR